MCVLILTGAGDKAFVAGADIRELSELTPVSGRDAALRGQAIFTRLETLKKPTIAAVNGFALGGGCELALACTLRLAVAAQPRRILAAARGEARDCCPAAMAGPRRLARLCGSRPSHAELSAFPAR